MKIQSRIIRCSAFALLLAAGSARAAFITKWDFNSSTPDGNTGTGTLSPGSGSGTLSLVGGATSTFVSGSPGDPAGGSDNSGLNLTTWAAQGTGSGTRGIQVAVSTVGFSDIVLSLDFRQSGTVSRTFQLQASADGATFNNVSGGTATVGTIGSGNTGTSFSNTGLYSNNPGGGSQNFVQSLAYTFAPGSIYENDPNFAFRWVAVFDPGTGTSYVGANSSYATSGTGRFDDVTVSGTPLVVPEPSTIALAGIGLAGWLALRRRARN